MARKSRSFDSKAAGWLNALLSMRMAAWPKNFDVGPANARTHNPRWQRWRDIAAATSRNTGSRGCGSRRSPGRRWLVPSRHIPDVWQRRALLEPGDLVGDITRDRVGIGVGGVVRGQRHIRLRPERAVLRQRLGLEHGQGSGAHRAVG